MTPPPPDREPLPVDHQRALLDNARFDMQKAAIASSDAQTALAVVTRDQSPQSRELAAAQQRARAANEALAGAKKRVRTERAALNDDLSRFLAPTPESEIGRLSASLPIVFLPVRIETRFTPDALLLRVYPDEVVADSFEPELTDEEIADGRGFWDTAWPGETEERAAWNVLVGQLGQPRASWVATTMTPLNIASRPAGSPDHRTPPRRASSWTRAAEARLLPDRWHVLLQTSTTQRIVTSDRAILEPLSLTFSPDPDDPTSPLGDDGLRLSDDVRWTVDFDAALKAGMAMSIPFQGNERAGFTRVIAFGVKSSLAPDVSASSLQELFEHHRHARGISLVAQGTPTNNTSAAASPFPPPDPDGRRSFAVERAGLIVTPGRDGARFASALGLASTIATWLDGADGREFERAGAMARALWPVTWRYFLSELMTPVFGTDDVEGAGRFFVNHVRGRGPYAAFRIGNTPYGVLPATAFAHWRPSRDADAVAAVLPPVLLKIRELWLSKSASVPHIGRTGDPDRDLLETLGIDASSREVRVRPVMGEDATWNLMGIWNWFDVWGVWLDASQAAAVAAVTRLGHPEWRPRIGLVNFDKQAWPFRYHLVTEDAVSETTGLSPNYIEWIRTASVPELLTQTLPGGVTTPVSLLYRLLRHAALLEYHSASFRLALRFKLVQADHGAEREIVGLAAQPPQLTRVQQMLQPIPALSGTEPIHAFLSNPLNAATIAALLPDEPVVGFRDALAALSGAATAELDRLFTETLDVASHRLDAWITAFASKRLEEMRAVAPSGCHLGAFGWVEDLVPKPALRTRPVRLRDGRAAVRQVDSGGYIHAPSMTHAAAAAVLRSGYLSRTGADRERYALDLSSARVRTARFVLDAVRADQPIGAVFGYQFERGLHDRALDKWIAPFRTRYPLAVAKSGDPEDFDPAHPDQPKDHIAARNVVDGLSLRTAFQAATIPWGQFGLPTGADRTTIEAELTRLDTTVDAVADLLFAESVYQLVKGSPSVAAATLDAVAQGTVRPPDPEIATQPRRGTPLTHKVVLLAGGNGQPLPAGYPGAPTPCADIEPRLDAWLGQVFGPAPAYECAVEFGPVGAPTGAATVTLDELSIRPIDVLLLARGRVETLPAATNAAASELDRRVVERAHAKLGLTVETQARIEYGRPAAGFDPTTDRSFADLLTLARAAEAVLAASRPLTPEDLVAEDRAADAAATDHRTAEALTRADGARQRLDTATQTLVAQLAAAKAAPAGGPFSLTALRNAFRGVAALGVVGAYPATSLGDTFDQRQQLIAQGDSVVVETTRRVSQAAALFTEAQKPDHAADARFLLSSARDMVEAICGRGMPFLPRFEVPAAAEVSNALGHFTTATFIDADSVARRAAVRRFERGSAVVRSALDAWRRLEMLAASVGRPAASRVVAQLPYEAGARWAARDFANETERPKPGRTSILLCQADAPAVNVPWAGLVVDQWVEMIPSPVEQTGVAFHYDDPGAEAPQTLLVAVPPIPNAQTWQLPWVVETLQETMDLARVRAVDGELLEEFAQLLPAITLADSTADVTIRTRFSDAVRLEVAVKDRVSGVS